jgi:hypothetical protein
MRERCLLAADGSHVALLCRHGAAVDVMARVPILSGMPAALLDALAEALAAAALQGAAAEVWLGAAWARLLAVDWPDAPLDRAERQALLEHRWSAVLPEPAGWQLMLAERGTPRLSVAWPTALVEGLEALLGARRIAARSLLPAACGALRSAGVRDGAALLGEGDRATLVECVGGEVRAAVSRRLIGGEDPLEWAAGMANGGRVIRLEPARAQEQPACVAWGGLWA